MNPKLEFINAIENDEYNEWKLTENVVLVTDWEGDGHFNPYVLDLTQNYTDEEINDIMVNAGVNDIFVWETLWKEDGKENEHYNTFYPEHIRTTYDI